MHVVPRDTLCKNAKICAELEVVKDLYGRCHNLLSPGEEEWNKWEAGATQAWVKIEFPTRVRFQGIGLKSAGDHPNRSPTMVRISSIDPITSMETVIGFKQLKFND